MTMNAGLAISRRGFARGLALCGAVALLGAGAARAPGAAEAGDPAEFVRAFSDRAIAVLADRDLAGEAREQAFRGLLSANFDVRTIGRFVLGRYWRKATKAERAEYGRLFEDLIVASYSRQLASYAGEALKVEGVRQQDERNALVASRILRLEGEPILVDWRLLRRGGAWRIVDVVVEGMSMALSRRSEYAAVIKSSGGRVEGLLAQLRQKTARLKSTNPQKADSTP
jgi:phospholipid transport system substrate-binding protein